MAVNITRVFITPNVHIFWRLSATSGSLDCLERARSSYTGTGRLYRGWSLEHSGFGTLRPSYTGAGVLDPRIQGLVSYTGAGGSERCDAHSDHS